MLTVCSSPGPFEFAPVEADASIAVFGGAIASNDDAPSVAPTDCAIGPARQYGCDTA